MDFASVLNYYCRKIGTWFLGVIPILLTILLFLVMFTQYPTSATDSDYLSQSLNDPIHFLIVFLYITLIIAAIPFSLNGFFMETAFNKEVKRITKTGLLIRRGVEGFSEVESSIKLLYRGSYSVIATVIISFLVFLSALILQEYANDAILFHSTKLFIFTASIGLLAISSGASILLKLPDKSALQPGGLMRYYSPKSLALRLDNILSDSIFTQLDPITRIKMDEWAKSISENFNVNFIPHEDNQTRLERAREKIFLLVYLKEFIPELMTEDIFKNEIGEIFAPNYMNIFIEGKDSGISLQVLSTIIRDVEKEIPQIFELVQRIFVLVKDNLSYLRTKEEIITICHPTHHIGNIDPFRIIIFILNLKKEVRKVLIQAQTSMSSLDPDDASQSLLLDTGDLFIPRTENEIKFSSSEDPVDIIRLVSSILQIGDALALQFRPNRFGTHVLNISIGNEEIGIITGKSVVIDVHRDIQFYVKTFGAKALGYIGAALSFIGIGLGSFVGLFG
ncbi:MAG: hypothetical protein EAX86_02745 [Candidatus Heimdallarchaeota archaeon]|nr:hypothetical protein [Candidatus Heimdallarchaeota archaeon]